MLNRLFRRRNFSDESIALYRAAVAQGRQPVFYSRLAVPDTVDGRFDLISLHVYLVFRRLKREGAAAEALAQDLAEVFFADMDVSLREMGAADIGVGRRVKKMIEGFYGRAAAYDRALAQPGGPPEEAPLEEAPLEEAPLEEALGRNLYGTVKEPPAAAVATVATYVLAAEAALAAVSRDELLAGRVAFPAPPAAVGVAAA